MFFVSMFVFVGCVPKNGIQEKIENVSVEAEDEKVNDEIAPVEKLEVEESKAEEKKVVEPKVEEEKVEEPKVEVVVPKTKVVMISDFAFAPNVVTLNVGDSVLWKHDDVAAHDVVSAGLFKSPFFERGGNFSFKFEKAGTYEYYCSIHPAMKGTVVVK